MLRYSAHPLAQMQRDFDRLFEQFDHDLDRQGLGGGMWKPAVDVKEDADGYSIHVEVPGVPQENLQIAMQDNVLVIRGHKEQKSEGAEGQFRRVERAYGSFQRSLSLPRNVDGSRVNAHLSDGVLEITLPKREESRPRQISIGVTSDVQNTPKSTLEAPAEKPEESKPEAPQVPEPDVTPQEETEPEGNPT